MIQIIKVENIAFAGFEALKLASEREGYRFLKRLEKDWLDHKNQFSRKGEGLYKVIAETELIGIGGINQCPYSSSKQAGRLRRFYIKKAWRNKGIGKMLLTHLLTENGPNFSEINLHTDTVAASLFYERNGFEKVHHEAKISHRLILS